MKRNKIRGRWVALILVIAVVLSIIPIHEIAMADDPAEETVSKVTVVLEGITEANRPSNLKVTALKDGDSEAKMITGQLQEDENENIVAVFENSLIVDASYKIKAAGEGFEVFTKSNFIPSETEEGKKLVASMNASATEFSFTNESDDEHIESISVGNVYVEGATCEIGISTKQGYHISKILINSTELTESEYKKLSYEEGTIVYVIENMTEDISLKVSTSEDEEKSDQLSPKTDGSVTPSDAEKSNWFIYNKDVDSVEIDLDSPQTKVGYYKTSSDDTTVEFDKKLPSVTESAKITELYTYDLVSHKGYRYTKDMVVVLDHEVPIINETKKTPAAAWTNEPQVRFDITLDSRIEKFGADEYGVVNVYWYEENESDKELCQYDASKGTYYFTAPVSEADYEGDKTYHVFAVDTAGNKSEKKDVSAQFDKTAPVLEKIEFKPTGAGASVDVCENYLVSTTNITVDLEAKDGASGIEKIALYKDEVKSDNEVGIIEKNGAIELKAKDFNGPDGSEIFLVVTDKAGNSRTYSDFSGINPDYTTNRVRIAVGEYDISYTLKEKENSNAKIVTKDDVSFTRDENFDLEIVIKPNNGIDPKEIRVVDDKNTQDKLGANKLKELEKLPDGSYKMTMSGDQLKLVENDKKNFLIHVIPAGSTVPKQDKNGTVFWDTRAPEIQKFEFLVMDSTEGNKIEEYFSDKTTLTGTDVLPSFGTFFNKRIQAIITPVDNEGSGVGTKQVVVKCGSKTYEIEPVNGKYTCFLEPGDFLDDNGKYKMGTLSAYAIDNLDNTGEGIEEKSPDSSNSNVRHSGFLIEEKAPKIECQYEDAICKKGNQAWYSSDVSFKINVSDQIDAQSDVSGLYRTTISINGTLLFDKQEEYRTNKAMEDELIVNTNQVERNRDGSYTLDIRVTDNAGNVTTKEITVYKDSEDPTVDYFDLLSASKSDKNVKNIKDFGVEKRSYGYYFRKDTTVVVHVSDNNPTSGLDYVQYYVVDKDGKNGLGIKDEEGKDIIYTKESPAEKEIEDGKIEFVVKAGFKGQVYARAVDCSKRKKESYSTPDSVVLETKAMHDEEERIILEKRKTKQKDVNGENDLYKKNVTVNVTVNDPYSGIEKVEYSVEAPYDKKNNHKGEISIDNSGELSKDSDKGWKRTKRDRNLVTELSGQIKVTNNSNDIVVTVKMTDRVGHTSTKTMEFSIDKTDPRIELSYDNNDSDKSFDGFYKKSRKAKITVYERNFDAKDIVYSVANADQSGDIPTNDLKQESSWKTKTNKKNPDETSHTAYVVFNMDGAYDWNLSYEDLAGNQGNQKLEEEFTVDISSPTVEVTYDNEQGTSANGIPYYDKQRVATISIKEHNFESGRVKITGKKESDGKISDLPALDSEWVSQNDLHTATITYSDDAKYTFDIAYSDKAGNEAFVTNPENVFVIDKTNPEIQMSVNDSAIVKRGETEIKSKKLVDNAYKNKKIVPSVSFYDVNIDQADIGLTLEKVNNNKSSEVKLDAIKINSQEKKETELKTFECNFGNILSESDEEKNKDAIYILTAKITDFAGRKCSGRIVFSVNRNGSVFTLGADVDSKMQNIDGKDQDMVYLNEEKLNEYAEITENGNNEKKYMSIEEINVDKVNEKSVKLTRVKDSEATVLDPTKNEYRVEENSKEVYENKLSWVDKKGNKNYSKSAHVKKDQKEWYTYTYNISRSTFQDDGVYGFRMDTEDEAKNSNRNEDKEIIRFTVDKTAPEVVPVNLENKGVYAQNGMDAKFVVRERNLDTVEIKVDNQTVEPDVNGEEYSFRIPEKTSKQDISIIVTDKAGNKNEIASQEYKDVLVTTNLFARWVNNTLLFVISLVVIFVGIASATGIFVYRRKVKKQEAIDNEA